MTRRQVLLLAIVFFRGCGDPELIREWEQKRRQIDPTDPPMQPKPLKEQRPSQT
jgi:hypothetical protein